MPTASTVQPVIARRRKTQVRQQIISRSLKSSVDRFGLSMKIRGQPVTEAGNNCLFPKSKQCQQPWREIFFRATRIRICRSWTGVVLPVYGCQGAPGDSCSLAWHLHGLRPQWQGQSGTNRGRRASTGAIRRNSRASAAASVSLGPIGVVNRTSAPSVRPMVIPSMMTLPLAR